MSKEAIIEKILSDAEIRANSFIEEQTAKADEILADAAEQCKSYYYTFKAETDKMVAELQSRAKTVAELDARKLMLASKTKMLDSVFERAVEKLAKLDKEQCKKLLLAMLVSSAEDGDVITLGKAQAAFISEDDVAAVAKQKGINLSLSSEQGDFDGMMLSNNGVDKNLTFEVEVALLREETETQIAKEIFG